MDSSFYIMMMIMVTMLLMCTDSAYNGKNVQYYSFAVVVAAPFRLCPSYLSYALWRITYFIQWRIALAGYGDRKIIMRSFVGYEGQYFHVPTLLSPCLLIINRTYSQSAGTARRHTCVEFHYHAKSFEEGFPPRNKCWNIY